MSSTRETELSEQNGRQATRQGQASGPEPLVPLGKAEVRLPVDGDRYNRAI